MEKNEFVKRYQLMGGDAQDVVIPITIRANPLRYSPDELVKRLAAKKVVLKCIPYLAFGYEVVSSPFSLGSCEEHLLGYFYVQSAPAQIPSCILGPLKTDIVLDACASPGGKTTHLAEIMGNEGVVVALEKK